MNRVRLSAIELRRVIETHRRNFHRLGLIRKPARKLDVPARHSASIGTEVLRDEKMLHAEASGFTNSLSSRMFSMR